MKAGQRLSAAIPFKLGLTRNYKLMHRNLAKLIRCPKANVDFAFSRLPKVTDKMAPRVASRREPIKLSFRDGELMVTPKDQDIFFINAGKATEACRDLIRQEERVSRFSDGFIKPLVRWCNDNAEAITACYVLVPESSVLPVYVIGSKENYDFELTKRLSDLSIRFEDENGWSMQASQIPKCDSESIYGYFNPDHAIQVFG